MQTPAEATSPLTLHALARELGVDVPEGPDVEITGVAAVTNAGPTEITFLANSRYVDHVRASKAAAVLVTEDFDVEAPVPLFKTKHPRLVWARLVNQFHPYQRPAPGVHPTAVVPDGTELGEDVHVGAYAVLGENVRLGARTTIHPHVVLYDDVQIGVNTEIHSHVSVRHGTRIGDDVIIHNGTILGADGFGFEADSEGRLHKVPQVGNVVIEDDVEIQANAAVDRSAVGSTRIGRNTKLDNFAQVAHGCTIGESTVVCGQVGLAGSTQVGSHVLLGGQCGFSGHTTVGDRVRVAAQSGIMRDCDEGKTYAGSPAYEISEMMRTAALLPRIPEMFKRLRRIENALGRLQAAQDDGDEATNDA